MKRTRITARSNEKGRKPDHRGGKRLSGNPGWLLLSTLSLLAFLSISTLSGAAHAQIQKVPIYTNDIDGAKIQRDMEVSYSKLGTGCEFRLEFNPSPGPTKWAIKEVSGDRGAPQRHTALNCVSPGFNSTEAANKRQYEEQTAYYWSKVAREYAVRRLWITPPGLSSPPRLAMDAVQPNVLTQGSFNNACIYRGGNPACMKVWPHEGPKIHIKEGEARAETIVHEFGHYAAGYVFGHMDPVGFSVPAALGDCAKLAFQEASATMFQGLVLHDVRYPWLVGRKGYGIVDASQKARWPVSCGVNNKSEYDTANPLIQAFLQSLWGVDASSTIKVNWRPDPNSPTMPNNRELANKTMANAFVYALTMNRGQRVDVMANDVLKWIALNEPKRSSEIWKIFESHGFVQKLGTGCVDHLQCASERCDNRPGAGCVSQDGRGESGAFCTTHQQCRSQHCNVASGKISGTCSTSGRKLGEACATHPECLSQRCDNRPGAGCVAQDGRGESGEFCTTHQQCRSQYCKVPGGKITGICTPR
jgi:hypothetical protein